MAKIELQMNGINELREALRKLPEDLANEASDIVLAHAEQAQRETSNAYPVRQTNLNRKSSRTGKVFPPGILKARVTVKKNRAVVSTSALVASRAPHAFMFEKGTSTRRTDKGWNRGKMPEAPVEQRMIPKAIRIRAKMVRALIEIVRKAGLDVQESA